MATTLSPAADSAGNSAVTYKAISQDYLAALKTLNSVIFPVKYHVRFLAVPCRRHGTPGTRHLTAVAWCCGRSGFTKMH